MSTLKNVKAFVGGFLLGGLLGGGVALLLTPQSGQEMRTQIKEQFEAQWHTCQEKCKETVDQNRHRAVDVWQQGRERMMEALSQGKEGLGQTVSHHPNDALEVVAGLGSSFGY